MSPSETDVHEDFVDAGSHRTRYLHTPGGGDRDTVLLLHDGAWGGSADISWAKVIPQIARNYRVLAPDLLGYGQTDKTVVFGRSPYGFRIAHIRDFLQSAGVSGALHVVGNSFGGSLALRAAAHECRAWGARSIVSIGGTGGPWRTPAALDALSLFDGTLHGMRTIARWLIDETEGFEAHVRARYESSRSPGHYEALGAARLKPPASLKTRPLGEDAWPQPLAACTTAMLLVWGERDRMVESGWWRNIQTAAPQAATASIDSRHSPNIDHAAEVVDTLSGFWDSLAGLSAQDVGV